MAAAAAAAARRLLSRRASSSSLSALLRRGAAEEQSLLLCPAVVATASRLGFLRGMARRPGGQRYAPTRPGAGGDRAPSEMALLFHGRDYDHCLIVIYEPGGEVTKKQQMIDCYIQILAKLLRSEEEAKKIYNVSCERYFGFGCEIDEETCTKLEGLPDVLFVLPDSYVHPEYKDYGEKNYHYCESPLSDTNCKSSESKQVIADGRTSTYKKNVWHPLPIGMLPTEEANDFTI